MKAGPILALSILAAALVSTAVTWFAVATPENGDSLTANADLEDQLSRSRERIADLEDQLTALADSQERLEKKVRAQNETLGFVNGLQEELLDLRMEMGSLRDRVSETPPLAALAAGKAGDEEFQALLEETLKKAVDSRVSRNTPADQVRAFQPFIKAGFSREMKRMAKKLNLNQEQKRRFDDTMAKAFDKSMPLVTMMMDTSRSKEERTQAYDQVQANYDEVNGEAASFLDPEQKKIFDEQQEKSRGDMDRLREMIESGSTPMFPGLPQPPQPPSKDL